MAGMGRSIEIALQRSQASESQVARDHRLPPVRYELLILAFMRKIGIRPQQVLPVVILMPRCRVKHSVEMHLLAQIQSRPPDVGGASAIT